MKKQSPRRQNHFVSQGYLKRWEASRRKVFAYRTLVQHERMPLWSELSIRGIAYRTHLYTQVVSGTECDNLEAWFDAEYEAPAEEAIRKVVTDARLYPSDWKILIRFLALQDVRNPVRLLEHLERFREQAPILLENAIRSAVEKLEDPADTVQAPSATENHLPKLRFPMRVTVEAVPGEERGILKAETAIGRSTWIHGIPRLLTRTAEVLHEHRWTIIRPSAGLGWFTSDNPVIRLNYYKDNSYDFKGGWGSEGTEIILPLSPEHLMYCEIGSRPPCRGTRFDVHKTQLVRGFIAENAHRVIFSQVPDPDVEGLRPRVVDPKAVIHERSQWARWHEVQAQSETELISREQDAQD